MVQTTLVEVGKDRIGPLAYLKLRFARMLLMPRLHSQHVIARGL